MDIGARPPELHGCWKTWSERDVDVVLRTDMDSGAVHTRRRFTGTARVVQATVTLPGDKHQAFMDWFRVNQRQGSIPTYVVPPYGGEEVFQWNGPPQIVWEPANNRAFTATVEMYQGSWFEV